MDNSIKCSECQGPTKGKHIKTARYDGMVYNCTSGCQNEKGYPLGTFPPRRQTPPAQPAPTLNPGPSQPPSSAPSTPQSIKLLTSIDFKLGQILAALSLKNDPLTKMAKDMRGTVEEDIPLPEEPPC